MEKLLRVPVQLLPQLVPVPVQVDQLLVEQGQKGSVETSFITHVIN